MDVRRARQAPPPGQRRADHTGIVGCDLVVDGVTVQSPGSAADLRQLHERAREHDGGFVWLGMHEPTEAALTRVAGIFGLHPLAVEDVLHREQRIKFERYEEVAFLVVRAARYDDRERITAGFVRVFVGPHFVVTVGQGSVMEFGALRARLSTEPELLARGPWSVVHALLDHLVDAYADIAAAMQADLDLTEAAVFAAGTPVSVEQLYQLKRQLMRFKAAVVPLHRAMLALLDKRLTGPPRGIRSYFQDVADQHTAVMEQVIGFDEVVNALLQARLTQVTVDQNNDMRKIASWAAIAAVPTVVGGVYGMNFAIMPELAWRHGYAGAMLSILLGVTVLYWLLRRAGWL
ncbi:magnesium transporter [Actinoplanes octamycinicus]|uniref:Magnesium transporter n=1 Tax=Actinoplanes octamycinicus TaxID=135948 RepID=A0A7W7M9Q1_9ACTN|nr:magnesium and cobalt transport protein CorA [Actinoplanes octamycinicus]MBB4742050.1 magnesium transporter [Actinoplanes octamycinicus]